MFLEHKKKTLRDEIAIIEKKFAEGAPKFEILHMLDKVKQNKVTNKLFQEDLALAKTFLRLDERATQEIVDGIVANSCQSYARFCNLSLKALLTLSEDYEKVYRNANNVTLFVQLEIFSPIRGTIALTLQAVERFIEIMKKLEEANDLLGMISVQNALESSAVRKLVGTMDDNLSPESAAIKSRMANLTSPVRNFVALRERMKEGNCIPALNLIKKDIICKIESLKNEIEIRRKEDPAAYFLQNKTKAEIDSYILGEVQREILSRHQQPNRLFVNIQNNEFEMDTLNKTVTALLLKKNPDDFFYMRASKLKKNIESALDDSTLRKLDRAQHLREISRKPILMAEDFAQIEAEVTLSGMQFSEAPTSKSGSLFFRSKSAKDIHKQENDNNKLERKLAANPSGSLKLFSSKEKPKRVKKIPSDSNLPPETSTTPANRPV